MVGDIAELVELSGTWLRPWVNGRRDYFIQIQTEKVTGRRLFAASTPAGPARVAPPGLALRLR